MNFIDLFSGCGGLSLGLLEAGYKGIFAIEKNSEAFDTFKHNLLLSGKRHFKYGYNWDESFLPIQPWNIHDLLDSHTPYLESLGKKQSIDLIVGGPPCQGFSMAGKRNVLDPRNQLAYDYLKVVNLVKPKILLMENVKGINIPFTGCGEVSVADKLRHSMTEMGYIPVSIMENSQDWGVPQKRIRYLLLGLRKDLLKNNMGHFSKIQEELILELNEFRKNFVKDNQLVVGISVGAAISDLKSIDINNKGRQLVIAEDAPGFRFKRIQERYVLDKADESIYLKKMRKNIVSDDYVPTGLRLANHSERIKNRFIKILKDIQDPKFKEFYGIGTAKNLPKKYIELELEFNKNSIVVLDREKPSVTITTLPDDIIHYDEPRILTVRENARIQSFPDWFDFMGSYTTGGDRRKISCPKYTQVGNAVPPLMAEGIGLFLLKKFN
ncbi:TPA: DNA cytosine methyltransferase [Providencia rettgeri]|uniref:DNA cytosine methyltransferase n=1 Tax=Providencia rettgeri TaxID=587 RepID=UPI001CA60ED3|nr:DNA cytosine methyltransferase [Providencia rettgeri]HEM7526649.1 DNA cytosine methyltransferase [Providencia rettgeri]